MDQKVHAGFHLPLAVECPSMIGPVYILEWMQGARRMSKLPWRWMYALVLFMEVQWLTINLIQYLDAYIREDHPDPSRLAMVTEALLYLVSAQQVLIILTLAPAFAAGSVTDEKRRGTLDFLLITPLSAGEIILGKWLGQATRVLYLISPGFFLLALLAGTVGQANQPVALAIVEQMVLTYAITAMSLLASIWNRSTPKAILVVYLFLALAAAGEWLLMTPTLASSLWAVPLKITITANQRLAGIAWLNIVALFCLMIAAWRLRPAHERQLVSKPTVLSRWWDRPPMSDAPMRWKERFIGDWMAIPIWSASPRWLRYLVIGGVVAGAGLVFPYGPMVVTLAIVQFVASGLFVGFRAAGAITGEREKGTWDSMLATRMDARQLVRGKLWGHIDAARPYMLVYLLPAVFVAWLTDPWLALGIFYAWLGSWILVYYFGAVGISASTTAPSTWRAIIAMLTGAVTSLAVVQLILTYFFIALWAGLAILLMPKEWHPVAEVLGSVLAPVPGLLWILAVAEERLEKAERTLIDNDRAGAP